MYVVIFKDHTAEMDLSNAWSVILMEEKYMLLNGLVNTTLSKNKYKI